MGYQLTHVPANCEVRTICQIAPHDAGDVGELKYFLEVGLKAHKEQYTIPAPDIEALIEFLGRSLERNTA